MAMKLWELVYQIMRGKDEARKGYHEMTMWVRGWRYCKSRKARSALRGEPR